MPRYDLLAVNGMLSAPYLAILKLYHMEKDLHMTDPQYNMALTIFFFS